MSKRIARWENGPQMEILRQLLDQRKERLKKAFFPKPILPKNSSHKNPKNSKRPRNPEKSKNTPKINQDQLAKKQNIYAYDLKNPLTVKLNSAITTSDNIPHHILQVAKNLKKNTKNKNNK